MRDSYTYMDTPVGEAAAKINAAYANGGIDCLLNTVENDYKIKIDHYFCVNFKTFVEVVDIIGGVRVPVQDYERRAMNGLAAESGAPMLEESGDSVLLTGKQALLYCRIRKCDVDGDVSRTRRQRQFMSALVSGARSLSVSDLPSLAKTLHKYVSTDCSVGDLVSLGTQALTEKWYKYGIESYSFPQEENRMDYSGHAWVWIVDYPADAKAMQLKLYGATNIELSDDRRTAIDIVRNGGF
jgi:LCP family protein required for cell wall assembly